MMLKELAQNFKSCLSYCFCFSKATAFASGLAFGHKLVDYSIQYFLIIYLANSQSELGLRKAAMYTFFHEGLWLILIPLAYTLDEAYSIRFYLIIFSAVVCVGALVLLSLISWGVLPTQDNLAAVTVLAVGNAGMKAFLKNFLEDQLWELETGPRDETKSDQVKVRRRVWWTYAIIGSIIASYLLDAYTYSWKPTFVVTASVMGGALILFLCGIPFYQPKFTDNLTSPTSEVDSNPFSKVDGNPFKTMLKVLQAARRNRQNDGNQFHLSPQVKLLRWMDKASIAASAGSTNSNKQICTETDVKNCKLLLKMVPLWSTFLAFNLTKATGNNLFSEQATNLKPELFLLLFVVIQKNIIPRLFSWLFLICSPKDNHLIQKLKILAGMILSPVCFAIAWKVEALRLRITIDSGTGTLSDPAEPIPMSIFWLAPQFFVLGLMDVGAEGLEEFLIDQFPAEWGGYISSISQFVEGIGNFLSIFCLHVCKSLFRETLDISRLDKYYEFILIIASVNVGYYILVQAIVYRTI